MPVNGGQGTLARAIEEQEERLLNCVHCGFCLPACPTYRRLGDEADSPRGRLYLMQAVVEGRLDAGSDAFQTHIGRCLGCRACEPVCPSGVEYGHLLELARHLGGSARRPALLARLLLRVFGTGWLARPAMLAGRVLRATGLPALATRLLSGRHRSGERRDRQGRGEEPGRIARAATGAGLGLAMLAASSPARELFHKRLAARPARREHRAVGHGKDATGASAAGRGNGATGASAPGPAAAGLSTVAPPDPPTVALLTGCVQAGLFARVNEATARVLTANGYRVVPAAAQGCCGALHAHGGDLEAARDMARRNIGAFEGANPDFLAMNASGCGAAMAAYGSLLADDRLMGDRARQLAERVRDVSQLLADRGPVKGAPLPLRVTYDAPCHLLHAQGVADPPARVLESVPGLEVVPLDGAAECCGGAGIYGLTHPGLGGWIGSDKVRSVLATGADALVTGNPGCMMQIGAGLALAGSRIPVVHLVELVDESYRRAGLYGPQASRGNMPAGIRAATQPGRSA
ncbi:MAG: 4Fe-4S dicluster domain-containing protein [Gemmatimonadetes bacterium]|nr:4Fe-4S dicluster domain-containing protein [Gemmatimonadota bacterium]MYB97256.1 4Fe-4S dicluster domain-containing protein [Gemmatimonadota bacterium]